MKKKILAVILTLAMVLTMFSGCGKKDSTYFKELKEISKITTGTSTAEISATYKGDDVADIPELFKNADGNVAFSLKMESTCESDTKAGAKILIKLGQETEYAELTTMVIDDKKIYLTVDPIISFVKKIDEATATELETTLSSMGITGSISLDLEQVLQAMGQEYPTVDADMEKSVYDMLNELIDAMENNFADLEGQDGDDYTLKVNSDNAEAAVNGVVNFLKNDAKGVLEKMKAMITEVYGEDDEMTAEMVSAYDEMINGLPDAVTTVEESKDDIIKTIKDYNINVTSTAQISGKSGSRVGKLTVDSGIIKIENSEMSIKISSEVKEGKVSVSEMIPENAADITTLLVTMFNQFSAYDTGMYDTESYDMGDMPEDAEISDDFNLETEEYYVE